MKVSATNPQAITSGTRKVQGNLGKNDFLQLLVAQIRYQDPLKPMDNQAFVAQLAQFSALEQMMNVGLASNMTYATAMLGKQVNGADVNGAPVAGKAVSVRLADGSKPMVNIAQADGRLVEVELSKVSEVKQ